MSFNVQHLNADSTFLLTFTPLSTPASNAYGRSSTFSILIDPWLEGHYTVWRPSFAIAYHTQRPSISSLKDMQDFIDVIVISQDKSDHCHEKTLCSLPRDTRVRIIATPAAAKKIWSWKYFENPQIVEVLPQYNASKPDTLIRIPLNAHSSANTTGEVTIANIPSKFDVANLHNAIGITYRPPVLSTTAVPVGRMISITNISSKNLTQARSTSVATSIFNSMKGSIESNSTRCTTLSSQPLESSEAAINQEKTISILYSPHGVSRSTIQPFVDGHLAKIPGALPLTALFHSFNIEANPWFMGGIVSAGAPGGAKLAKALKAKYWIGAHDEVKDVSGLAIRFIRKEQFDLDKIRNLLRTGDEEKVSNTQLAILACGEERRFTG